MTKAELKEMIRECLREELSRTNLKKSIGWDFSIEGFAHEVTDTFEDAGEVGHNIIYGKDGTDLVEVEVWESNSPVTVIANLYAPNMMQQYYDSFTAFAEDLKYKCDRYLREDLTLIESSLTAEEKVDAWHNGTRRENYKAAGIPKLQTFLDIAKRKGYSEIVDIIEAELTKRGVTPVASTPIATTNPVSTSTAPTSEVEPDVEVPATDTEEPAEPPHFSDELVKEPEAPVLSDKEKDILIGQAIDYLGKVAFYARSYWRTAMGFIGSYSTTWYNSNGNEVKPERAKDKIRDLTYASDRLIVLRSHFDGGSHNIDRYYSIEIPSSTKYIVDRNKIRDMMYASYYDSEIDWRISTLAKTTTNRKKFKQYLIDTAGMPIDQAEELTTYAFDKRVW